MHRPRFTVVLAIAVSLISTTTFAADPFSLSASGGGVSVTATGDDLVDLAGNLIDSEDQFAPLNNRSFTGALRYGELDNAVLFSRNAAGTSATLTIPSTGFQRTFTASNEDDLEDQIRDFFEQEGADAYADFLREIAEQTSFGVNDGNPLATTALLADIGFYRFGFLQRVPGDDEVPLPTGWDLRLSGGVTETDVADGWYGQGGFATSFRFGDRVGFTWANTFRYRDVEGSAIYQYGTTLALPIAIISGQDGSLAWHLTPAFVGGFGGSWDLAAGGILAGGQLTSSLSFSAGGWTFVLANQVGFYEGLPIDIADFRFETDTSQVILKNGVQLVRDLGDDAFLDAGVVYTNLLEDAFIEDYLTPFVGIGFRLGGPILRLGYHADIADDWTTHSGDVSLLFSF